MQQALKSLFAVAEAYPQLQASQNFLQLQQSIVDTEDKIQASRRFYNGGVRELNTKIKVFPNNLFARNLGFNEREFFEVVDGAAIIASRRACSSELAGVVPRDRAQQAQHVVHPRAFILAARRRRAARGWLSATTGGSTAFILVFATGYATFQYFFADREAIAMSRRAARCTAGRCPALLPARREPVHRDRHPDAEAVRRRRPGAERLRHGPQARRGVDHGHDRPASSS